MKKCMTWVILSLLLACSGANRCESAQVWTDVNGDGLPDTEPMALAPEAEPMAIDVWIDSDGFAFTAYVVYLQHSPKMEAVKVEYLMPDGNNFPIDDFTSPNTTGIGSWGLPRRAGVFRVGTVWYYGTKGGTVIPIIDSDSPVGSALTARNEYETFSEATGTIWR